MKKHRSLLVITLVGILIITVYYHLSDSIKNLKYVDTPVFSTESIERERKWLKIVWEEDLDLQQAGNDSLFNPVLLESNGDRIYVGDWGDMKIKILSNKGLYVNSIGNRGRGPGEFQRIMDIDFSHDSIFISDPEKNEIIIYSKTGEYSHSIKIEYPSYRLAASESTLYTLAIQDSLFGMYDIDGNLRGKFGKILDDPVMNRLSLSGRIEFIDQLGLFLYVPRFASYLYYYSYSGSLEKIIESIDRIPFANADHQVTGNQMKIRPPNREVEIRDQLVEGDKLYLLGFFKNGDSPLSHEYFIDVYAANGDEYFHSFRIPTPSYQFTKIGNVYYFIDLTDQSLSGFKKEIVQE